MIFGITASTARLLFNRGKTSVQDIKEYLYPDESMLHSPKLMRNLCEAADVIEDKLSSHAKIRVIGDYDADGIMSTYILTDALKRIGAEADFYIPDRIKDGYGINEDMIRKAHDKGYRVNLYYYWLESAEASYRRVLQRAEEGRNDMNVDNHSIPEDIIRRRYPKSIDNLINVSVFLHK